MTNEFRNGANPAPVLLDDEDVGETLQESLWALKKVGIVVDSGHRKWSEQTGRYEILWKASPQCNGGYDSDECFCRDLPFERLADKPLTGECPLRIAGSTGQCNTARSLSAGVSKPKVFRGR